MNEIFFAFFAIEANGFSIKVSISSPIQKIISACSINFAWEGFNTKLWGELLPSIIIEGSPIPFITFETNEWRGFIVVTTLMSAFADNAPIKTIEKIKVIICPKNDLSCFILIVYLKN